MTEQELEKLYEQKQQELGELRREIGRIKYAKHMDTLLAALRGSDAVLEAICRWKLNADDCRYLGGRIADQLPQILREIEPEIRARQEKRKRKSRARQERRARQKGAAEAPNPPAAEAEGGMGQERRIY